MRELQPRTVGLKLEPSDIKISALSDRVKELEAAVLELQEKIQSMERVQENDYQYLKEKIQAAEADS